MGVIQDTDTIAYLFCTSSRIRLAKGQVILCLHTTNNAKFHISFLLNLFRADHLDLAGPLSIIM